MYSRVPLPGDWMPVGVMAVGMPNLVAMMTSPRRSPRALPRISSEGPCSPAYISAVSKKFTPSSIALSTTALAPSWPMRMPKLLQPSPTTETCRSELPMLR